MTRESAIGKVSKVLACKKNDRITAHRLITLFGLEAEELSEAGVDYENLKSFESVFRS